MAFLACSITANSQRIAGGSGHGLLICTGGTEGGSGTLQAWGFNYHGQLGYGPSGNYPLPTVINGVSNLTDVSGGSGHSLLRNSAGQLMVMGKNDFGQLGLGDTLSTEVPTIVPGFSGVSKISAGWEHSLVLKNDGTVWAWGHNAYGQLGLGDTLNRTVPTQVPGLSGITAIAAGRNHCLAVGANGVVWAWGWNPLGQLGDGTTANSLVPIQVPGLSDVAKVMGGDWHSVALKSDGTVWAWGFNNDGEIGQGSWSYSIPSPTQVPGLSGITDISTGRFHNVALTSTGTVWSWGSNAYGEIGDGTTEDALSPVQMPGISDVGEIAAGDEYTLILKNDGTVWGVGLNGNGQLGNGTMWNQFETPEPVTGPCTAHQTNGIGEEAVAISVFPNPATDVLTIRTDGAIVKHISLSTTDGRYCACRYDANAQTIDVRELASGAYFLTVETTLGSAVRKIVRE